MILNLLMLKLIDYRQLMMKVAMYKELRRVQRSIRPMAMTIVSLIVLRVLNCRRLALAFVLVHQYTKTEEVDEKNQMISECLPVEILDEASLVFLM